VNIFASPGLVSLTVFASLLPDIDHSRSVIGKIFLPVARWLDRRYGHRTITHSLLFFVFSAMLVKAVEVLFGLENLFLVYCFALSSHLIFDMLTRQGIPLLYPFYRNPCVIGSNPDLRLSGKGSGELVVFSFFVVMLYFCFPLFNQGFWVSYNKNFNTLSHLHSSANQVETLLQVEYDFSNPYGHQTGSGMLLHHEKNEAIIKTPTGLVKISSGDVIHTLQYEITDRRKEVQTIGLVAVSLDSLRTYAGNLFMSGTVVSEDPFLFEGEATKKAEFEWVDGFTMDVLLKDSSELQIKRLEWEHKQALYGLNVGHYRTLQQMEAQLLTTLESASATDYERETSTTKLRQVRRELDGYQLDDSDVKKAKGAYDQVGERMRQEQRFSGRLVLLKISE
jgi:inner membrane protein